MSLAPCSSARSLARGRDGSTAARRRVTAARRSSRRRSRALLAPARSAAAFATARHSAAAQRGGLRLCAGRGASLAPCSSARSLARGRDGSTAARRRVTAALAAHRGDARARYSRPLGRPPRSRRLDTRPSLGAAAYASCVERGASLAPCSCAVTHLWPRRLDGRPPSSRCCSPLVAATLARATRARSIGRRVRDGSTLGRRSVRRPTPPALNAARLLRRAPLRGHTLVAATARRPRAVKSLLLAARRGDARACYSRSLDRPPRSRRLDTRPPLDAAAFASCVERGASLAPFPSARSHARGRDGSTAARRRVAAARCLARRARARCSRPLDRPPRSRQLDARASLDAAAFASALDAARLLRRAPLRGHSPVAATARRPPAVESRLLAARRGVARARCSRLLGRPPRSRRPDTRPPLDAAAFASALDAARLLRRAPLRGHSPVAATARRPPAVESRLLAARRGAARARCSRPLGRPPRSRRPDTRPPLDAAAFASALDAARLLRRAPLRSHSPVAATVRRPPAVESRLLAARRGVARARCSRPLGRPPRSRRPDTRPPLDAAAFASALNAARLLRRAPLRSHSPVATTARRPLAVESLLLAA